MSARRPHDILRDLDAMERRIERLELIAAAQIPELNPLDAPVKTTFISTLDGKLYFKDAVGTDNALY